MIHGVTSDLPSFKRLTFGPGLNILLADKSEGATDRQSRNGAGKTSLVELIHFLFGANADKDSIFRSDELARWSFEARVDVGPTTVDVARSGAKPSRIRLQGDPSPWPIHPTLDGKSGELVFSNEQWRSVVGAVFFGLHAEVEEEAKPRFRPTFRSLFSYFARRQNSGGFLSPTQHSTRQQPWDQQVSISYLLSLDANIPQQFQVVRAKEKAMTELRKIAKEGELGRYFETAANLRTRLTIAEARARRLREKIASFNVVPEYAELEREASEITHAISALNDENTIDRELILQLQDALTSEQPPPVASLDRLYREAGVVLPETVASGSHFAEEGDSRRGEKVIQAGCGGSRRVDRRVAGAVRGSAGPADGPQRPVCDGRHRAGGVLGVLHAEPVVFGASAGPGAGAGPVELRDAVRDDGDPQ